MTAIPYRTPAAFIAGLALAVAAGFMFQAWDADAAPGDTDTTFVPMSPCRLIDTRPAPFRTGPLGAFGADDTKTVQAHGSNGDCTIPADAVGLLLNVTADGATAPTFLTIWADGARPVASSLNPFPGEPPTPNTVTTELSNAGSFEIFNLAGTVNVIVDVNGYQTSASLVELASRVSATEAEIAALEARQPLVLHTGGEQLTEVDSGGTIVRSLSLVAPSDGTVIVNSSHHVAEATAGDGVVCSINIAGTGVDSEHVQAWQSGGLNSGGIGQMSGTRGFDISGGGPPYAVYLYCQHTGTSGSSNVYDSSLTAVFYPTP